MTKAPQEIHFTSKDYATVKPFFRPLDLVFFRGTDVVSDTISLISAAMTGEGSFSHCGLIINKESMPTVPQLEYGKWYLWESTFTATGFIGIFSDGTPPVGGSGKFGVQIRDLESVITTYTKLGGKVAWGPLLNNPWDSGDRKWIAKKMSSLHEIVGNRMYDINCLSLFAAAFPCLRRPRDLFNRIVTKEEEVLVSSVDPDDNLHPETRVILYPNNKTPSGWLFCSELVAVIYQKLGLIGPQFNPQDVMPVDFLGVDRDGIRRLVADPVYMLQPRTCRFLDVSSVSS